MEWEEVSKLPEWLRELHGAVGKLNLVVMASPPEFYEDVKFLRDKTEAIWLQETNRNQAAWVIDEANKL